IVMMISYPHLPSVNAPVSIVFILTFAIALPFIFHTYRQNRIDRIIGELSYPLYICHIFIQQVAWAFYPGPIKWGGLVIVVASILFSILLFLAIESPLERIRARLA